MVTRKHRNRRRKIRYAVVGLGYISQIAVLPAFAHARENSELTALVSGDAEKLRKLGRKYGIENTYSYEQYGDCLKSGEIDAVYIGLPNNMHRAYTESAAETGIHVLCEKPMAMDEDECQTMIAAVKNAVGIPVIGNGDIRTPEDAAAMIEKTGCDAVMIGRAAPANPWIFRQIAQYTATKEATGVGTYDQPSDNDRYQMIRTYFQMLVDEIAIEEAAEAARAAAIVASGQVAREQRHRDAVGKMKQFAAWFTHGVPGGAALRKAIFDAKSGQAVLGEVERFFESRANAPEPESFTLEHDSELESAPAAWG